MAPAPQLLLRLSLSGDFDIHQVAGLDLTFGDSPAPTPYAAAGPTGWRSTGARRGPDPDFTTARRMAGLGA